MTDCAFTGTVSYKENAYSGGSMVGFTQEGSKAYLTNCLFSPKYLLLTMDGEHPHVFVSGKVRGNLTNCYYNDVARESILENEGIYIDTSKMNTTQLAEALGSNWEVSGNLVLPKSISGIKNPIFAGVTIQNVAPTVVSSDDGKVSFVGSYAPVSGAKVMCLGSNNKLQLLGKGKMVDALHAVFLLYGAKADVNGDSDIDISDVVGLVNIILSDGTDGKSSADVNGDSLVDISDVVALVDIILSDDSPSIPKINKVITNVGIGYQ